MMTPDSSHNGSHSEGFRQGPANMPDASIPGKDTFWSVVPAGGSGTRLWPLSRVAYPKFLLPLVHKDQSLLQETVQRLSLVSERERVLIVAGPQHAVPIGRQLPDIGEGNIVIEPSPKGTGPAIALAAALIARRQEDAYMGSFAADHYVRNPLAFQSAVHAAIQAASAGWLVTIGINPTHPETGYGYIERDSHPMSDGPLPPVYQAIRFVEKPDLERAKSFLDSGRFMWNAGMFVWSVNTFMNELHRFLPEVADSVERIADAWESPHAARVLEEIWPMLPDVSIDTGIMERSERVAVVPSEMGWSDIGDWHGLGTTLDQDAGGNSGRGDIVATGCTNTMVWSESSRLISLIGLDSVVVVDTPDALLIADRAQAQAVRSAVNELRALNRMNVL